MGPHPHVRTDMNTNNGGKKNPLLGCFAGIILTFLRFSLFVLVFFCVCFLLFPSFSQFYPQSFLLLMFLGRAGPGGQDGTDGRLSSGCDVRHDIE